MSPDRLRALVEPLLEALAERVYWAPVVFLPVAEDWPVVACGSTPKDVDLAQEVLADGRGLTESVLVGVDRWVRVFPATHLEMKFGHVVLLARVAESNVPALTRLVGVLSSVLVCETAAGAERVRRRELEHNEHQLAGRIHALDVDRRFHEELHQEMATTEWHQKDSEAGSLQRLVGCLARHLGAPVVLQGRNLLTLAGAGDGHQTIALSPSRHQAVRDVVQPLSRAKGIVELPSSGAIPRRLVAPVWGGGEVLGFLTAAPTGDEDVVARSLECTVGFVAMERIIRAELEEAHQLDRETLLRDLFSGTSLHRLVNRGLRMDVDLRRPYIPLAFAPAVGTTISPTQLRSVVADALRESFGATNDALAAVFDDAVVALVPEDALPALSGTCERVIKHADGHGWKVRGGMGPVCRELGDYEAAVRKARWVIGALDSMDGQAWAHFEDFGIYSILFDKEQSGQLDDFVERQLGALMTYDGLHRTDLVETLRCVLDTGAVLTEAAKQLYIHISTLKYRVNRIEELLGVELRNAQTAFDLHLACKILAVRRRLSAAGAEGLAQSSASAAAEPAAPKRRSRTVPAEGAGILK